VQVSGSNPVQKPQPQSCPVIAQNRIVRILCKCPGQTRYKVQKPQPQSCPVIAQNRMVRILCKCPGQTRYKVQKPQPQSCPVIANCSLPNGDYKSHYGTRHETQSYIIYTKLRATYWHRYYDHHEFEINILAHYYDHHSAVLCIHVPLWHPDTNASHLQVPLL
jgi:hypothetical protein